MEAAKSGYERIVTSVSNLNYLLENASSSVLSEEEKSLLKEAEEFSGTASSTISKLCKENTNMHQSNGYMFGRDIEIMKPYREV